MKIRVIDDSSTGSPMICMALEVQDQGPGPRLGVFRLEAKAGKSSEERLERWRMSAKDGGREKGGWGSTIWKGRHGTPCYCGFADRKKVSPYHIPCALLASVATNRVFVFRMPRRLYELTP